MPYKFEYTKTKIPAKPGIDRRVKLTEDQKAEIRELYGQISQRKLAGMYGVSGRLIIFIGDPEQHKANLRAREERGGSAAYYDREKHNAAMKKHRQHKQKLFKKNLLIPPTN